MNKKVFDENQYRKDAENYKKSFYSSALMANQVVNISMLLTFHGIGGDVRKKGIWIDEYIKRISKEFLGHSLVFSEQNIRSMCKFSSLVELEEIFVLRLYEIPWGELITIMESSNSHDEFIASIQDERGKGDA